MRFEYEIRNLSYDGNCFEVPISLNTDASLLKGGHNNNNAYKLETNTFLINPANRKLKNES